VVTYDRLGNQPPHSDPDRPADETAFAANEAKIAKSITEAARSSRKPPVKDPSVIEYEGNSGFPSFCQVAHRRQGDRVQFALIHMANGGTSPTNMFESLATYMRQRFYPDVDAGRIDWYDVVPAGVYHLRESTEIDPVTMQHANGIYSNPSWWHKAAAAVPEDWAAFISETITRGQTARRTAEAAPHADSGKKKPVAR
jgi:hypothetical protein